MSSPVVNAIRGEKLSRPPFWFMRQAGRYLPEYRELREKAGSFLTMCYTPDLAAEVTLQPLRRFDMDAAIIFSDILVIPHAMGVDVNFVKGEGPKLSQVRDKKSIDALRGEVCVHLAPVGQAISQVRRQLPETKSLIGFCGAPWTVACYMVEGENKGNGWQGARSFASQQKNLFSVLIDKLVKTSAEYLSLQIEAGADVIQIFDSWAGVLSEKEYQEWVIAPTKELVDAVRSAHPSVPIIGFPRGSSGACYAAYEKEAGVDAIGIDVETSLSWAFDTLKKPLQGNLDPLVLANDKQASIAETKRILETASGKPFIFNLGHGILPQTPLETVAAVCETIRGSAP